MQKRYIFLVIVIISVVILIWQVSSSYGYVNKGYEGNNVVSGDKWGVNITEISDINKSGSAELSSEISTIGTTLNFDAVLFKPGDKISFNITVTNTASLDAELYAMTLTGLSEEYSEFINYSIMPIDYLLLHEDNSDGSIMKKNEKQVFNINVEFDRNHGDSNHEIHLNLGSTIIYKQK